MKIDSQVDRLFDNGIVLETDDLDRLLIKFNRWPDLVELYGRMVFVNGHRDFPNPNIIPALHRYHLARARELESRTAHYATDQ